ncbi:hypothetical protein [Achromobacter sp.]|uniref:type II toxin-antitoxin system RelE family toxin n=1 Tax=Achromobacter sp. TaxID=134375 RepID=UPI0028B25F44|nr:hypothetical protein [Achromobacter sp.]
MKIDWTADAAKAILRLASADQRRVIDAVEDFSRCFKHEAAILSSEGLRRVGGYQISFGVVDDGIEVRAIKLSGDRG